MELKRSVDRDPAYHGTTGIFVRAQNEDGKWSNYDIAELDLPSLKTWLRSRGGVNKWAETVVAIILGYESDEITKTWSE